MSIAISFYDSKIDLPEKIKPATLDTSSNIKNSVSYEEPVDTADISEEAKLLSEVENTTPEKAYMSRTEAPAPAKIEPPLNEDLLLNLINIL